MAIWLRFCDSSRRVWANLGHERHALRSDFRVSRESDRVQRYQLGKVYAVLRQAIAAGDVGQAATALGVALGMPFDPVAVRAHLAEAGSRLRPQLTYRGWKPAEVAMLRHEIKPLVKFEDISLAEARAADWPAGVRVVASKPYVRDDLLLRSQQVPPSDPRALVSLYASRDDRGERLRALERAHPEDIRGAGELLSIPPCCAAAFATAFDHSRSDQDDLNDEAAWRLLRSGGEHPPWLTNPLSDRELLGFYPCSLRCERALQRASRVAQALPEGEGGLGELARPVLFWRLPFFLILPEQPPAPSRPGLHMVGWEVNAFVDRTARVAQTLLAAQWLAWSRAADGSEANRLVPHEAGLAFWRDDELVREVEVSATRPPALVRWG